MSANYLSNKFCINTNQEIQCIEGNTKLLFGFPTWITVPSTPYTEYTSQGFSFTCPSISIGESRKLVINHDTGSGNGDPKFYLPSSGTYLAWVWGSGFNTNSTSINGNFTIARPVLGSDFQITESPSKMSGGTQIGRCHSAGSHDINFLVWYYRIS